MLQRSLSLYLSLSQSHTDWQWQFAKMYHFVATVAFATAADGDDNNNNDVSRSRCDYSLAPTFVWIVTRKGIITQEAYILICLSPSSQAGERQIRDDDADEEPRSSCDDTARQADRERHSEMDTEIVPCVSVCRLVNPSLALQRILFLSFRLPSTATLFQKSLLTIQRLLYHRRLVALCS